MSFDSDDHDCVKCKGRFPKLMFDFTTHGSVCQNCRRLQAKLYKRRKAQPFEFVNNNLNMGLTLKSERRLATINSAERRARKA